MSKKIMLLCALLGCSQSLWAGKKEFFGTEETSNTPNKPVRSLPVTDLGVEVLLKSKKKKFLDDNISGLKDKIRKIDLRNEDITQMIDFWASLDKNEKNFNFLQSFFQNETRDDCSKKEQVEINLAPEANSSDANPSPKMKRFLKKWMSQPWFNLAPEANSSDANPSSKMKRFLEKWMSQPWFNRILSRAALMRIKLKTPAPGTLGSLQMKYLASEEKNARLKKTLREDPWIENILSTQKETLKFEEIMNILWKAKTELKEEKANASWRHSLHRKPSKSNSSRKSQRATSTLF